MFFFGCFSVLQELDVSDKTPDVYLWLSIWMLGGSLVLGLLPSIPPRRKYRVVPMAGEVGQRESVHTAGDFW